MKTTIERATGRILKAALALWRHLNPLSSAADRRTDEFRGGAATGPLAGAGFLGGASGSTMTRLTIDTTMAISGASRTGKSLLLVLYLEERHLADHTRIKSTGWSYLITSRCSIPRSSRTSRSRCISSCRTTGSPAAGTWRAAISRAQRR